MTYAKEHYFDGINDNLYADKDSITGNLHAFQELTAEKKWIYNSADKTGTGIIPDEQFTDSWEMEGAGYNKFKSSNNAVVAMRTLLLPEEKQTLRLQSLLYSAVNFTKMLLQSIRKIQFFRNFTNSLFP